MGSVPTVRVADGVVVEVHDAGAGEPLLLIQTALAADELVPLGREVPQLPGDRLPSPGLWRQQSGARSRNRGT